jgi:hypothetical protein
MLSSVEVIPTHLLFRISNHTKKTGNTFQNMSNRLFTVSSAISSYTNTSVLHRLADLEVDLQQKCPSQYYPKKHPLEKQNNIPNLALILDKKSTLYGQLQSTWRCPHRYPRGGEVALPACKGWASSDSAQSLLNLANRLADIGDHDQSLEYAREEL